VVNGRYVLNQVSLLLAGLSIALAATAGWSAWDLHRLGVESERAALPALLLSALGGGLLGATGWFATRRADPLMARREALLLVALSWFVGAALAALPLWLWGRFAADMAGAGAVDRPGVIDCYFEAMSGLTTTGATIFTDLSVLPPSLLLWRALTHWFGGLGIVVLFVAVLPSLGVGGKKLYKVEAPGPSPEGVHPHIRETARVLWMLYLGLTAAQTIALRLAGMSWHDALCHTFATLATGGFSTLDSSVGGYASTAVNVVVILFMFLAGINFGIYVQLLRGRTGMLRRDVETRVYVTMVLAASAIIVSSLLLAAGDPPIVTTDGRELEPDVGAALEHGIFAAVAIQTTTGFGTADFDRWPEIAKIVLVGLMFVGGSAGSTAGGIKVVRIWIAVRVMVWELERAFRPNVVRPLKIGGTALDPELKLATLAYVLGILVLWTAGTVLLLLLEPDSGPCDFATAATASVATLCNVGPGLAAVAPTGNSAWFGDPAKCVMIVLMALGRLEVYAIMVLFMPRFWSSD